MVRGISSPGRLRSKELCSLPPKYTGAGSGELHFPGSGGQMDMACSSARPFRPGRMGVRKKHEAMHNLLDKEFVEHLIE